jgi:hypothetical protein
MLVTKEKVQQMEWCRNRETQNANGISRAGTLAHSSRSEVCKIVKNGRSLGAKNAA